MSDRHVLRANSIEDLRLLARRRLPQSVFDFFDGGAEDELTMQANRDGFARIRLRPRILVDVAKTCTSTTIAGKTSAAPVVIAPTGASGTGWPQADLAIARAAARLGIPYTLSTMATTSIESIADKAGGRLWFQLYVLRDREFCDTLIHRAASAGFEALVVTLDLATGGKRERDLRNRFSLPLQASLRGAIDFAGCPGWCWQMLRHGQPRFENLRGFEGILDPRASIAAKVGQSLDAAFDWDALRRLRDRWHRPLIAKGVIRAEDAARLREIGVDAIWVSNHGGRQLDGAMATIDALPAIVGQVGVNMPVIVDSGVRRGADIVKALALGAEAVAIGRAVLYGAAAGGDLGAERALQILTDELERTMQLCGTPRICDIDASLIHDGGGGP